MPKSLPHPTSTATIDIGDGIERELRFSLRAMRALKEKLGGSMLTGSLPINEDTIGAILWEGLANKEGLNEDALGDLPVSAFPYLVGKITEAFTGSLPEQAGDPNEQSSQAQK